MEKIQSETKKHITTRGDYDSLERVNELNKHTLISLSNQIKRAESTKAWKVMCGIRRLNEQFIKGTRSEKKKFIRWTKNKLFKKAIQNDLELSHFSPIKHNIEIHEIEYDNTPINNTKQKELQIDMSYQYKKYNTPKYYDVFRFPVIEWDFRWQRPQQISSQFADAEHRVFYFSIETESTDANSSFEDVAKKVQIRELRSNVWWVKLCSFHPLNAYRDTIDQQDLKFMDWSLRYVKEKFSIDHTISIVDLPFWAPLVYKIPNSVIMYDCMDDHAGFSTNSDTMLSKEDELIKRSDLVITTSQILYEKVEKQNDNTILVRNAGEYQYFSTPPSHPANDIPTGKGHIIGYYGAISEWFDIKLIENLAKRNKEWTFVLVGDTYGCDIEAAQKLNNVIFTGEKPYSQLTQYLYSFDVCLIPFIVNNLTLSTNPVKVYEYLAAGKPVVSIDLPELQMMSSIVRLATDVAEFEKAINESLIDNSIEKIKERMLYAENNSWKARYEQINTEINSRFYPKISIVIVTYNNWSYTKQCLESLLTNSDYPNLEIIIVDNDSQDETRIELSRIRHSQVKIILSPDNTGFAGGNAMGCRASTGDYIILLNNDTIVPKGWVEKLITPLRADSTIGMVGPMSNSVGNDQMLDHFVGNGFEGPDLNWLEEFYLMYEGEIHFTELLGFYCVAIKREVYEIVGDLDVNFGLGMFEDDDYCERVRNAGYKLAIVEDAFVYHHGSVSFKKLEDEKYRTIFNNNKSYFERKWNKEWVNPKPPRSIFHNLYDTESIAEAISSLGKKTVLLLGNINWSIENQRIQQIAKLLSKENNLIITYAHHYHSNILIGNRKLSPNIYLTNRLDLFMNVKFDLVIYSGFDELHPEIIGSRTVIDKSNYDTNPKVLSSDKSILELNIQDVNQFINEIKMNNHLVIGAK